MLHVCIHNKIVKRCCFPCHPFFTVFSMLISHSWFTASCLNAWKKSVDAFMPIFYGFFSSAKPCYIWHSRLGLQWCIPKRKVNCILRNFPFINDASRKNTFNASLAYKYVRSVQLQCTHILNTELMSMFGRVIKWKCNLFKEM